MPSNPHKNEQYCRVNLHKILTQALPRVGSMLYADLIREAILQYPVSPLMVKRFVQEYYIDTGVVKLNDGVLTYIQKEEIENVA